MIKVKTSDLIGPALDSLMAKIEDEPVCFDGEFIRYVPGQFSDEEVYSPSTDPAMGQPIMEREKLQVRFVDSPEHPLHGLWLAQDCRFRPTSQSVGWSPAGKSYADLEIGYLTGPTMLIAAMRFFVYKTLGKEVEVSADLLGK
jgi:hypothetical protein